MAQMAGGVPAMCDGITQGRAGMELSLFSRDVVAGYYCAVDPQSPRFISSRMKFLA